MLGATSTQIQLLVKELPPWVIVLGISGRDVLPEERIELQKKAITDIAQQFGLQLRPTIPGAKDSEVLELITNPSRVPYWKLNHKKGCQDILFLTTLNKTSELIKTMSSVAETYKYSASELGIYVQPLHQGVSCHCEFMLTYDSSDYSTVNNIQTLINKASIELINHNAFFSRPYGIWANMVYDRDKQTTTILKKVKGLFDPNNVMNPGKLCF
jgi:FAD/FMN-containing dehydrogenase